jgi:uncharacterized protein YecA (UPF0149 family)
MNIKPYMDVMPNEMLWPKHDRHPFLHPGRKPKPPVGRNEPCPCGSGKKYKKCCGAVRQEETNDESNINTKD